MSIVSLVIAPYLAVDNTPVHASIKKEISIEKKKIYAQGNYQRYCKKPDQIPGI